MFCAECGQKLNDGAKFCSNCGKPVNQAGNISGEQVQPAELTDTEKVSGPVSIFFPDVPGETMDAETAAISSDGKTMAMRSRVGNSFACDLNIIDTLSGKTVQSIVRGKGYLETIRAVSSDGNFVVIECSGEGVYMVNIQTGEQIELDMENSGGKVCFSPDSKRLAYSYGKLGGVNPEYLTTLALPKGDKVWSITVPPKQGGLAYVGTGIYSIAYSQDRCFLVTGHHEGTILWDARNGNKIFAIENGVAYSVDFSPDGNRIVTAGYDGDICILDGKSGDLLLKFELPAKNAQFSPDGSAITVCGGDDSIKIINAETGEVQRQLHADQLEWASYTSDGKKFISFSRHYIHTSKDEIKYWVSE